MELNQEERRVLAVLDEVPVKKPIPNPAAQVGQITIPLQDTIDKLLRLSYIQLVEMPPKSGEFWYFYTAKVPR